jgi:hypothetical protein
MSLQITHGVYFSQPNSFLVIILQLPVPKEDSTQFNSSASSLISWQAGVSTLDSPLPTTVLYCRALLYSNFARTTQKKPVSFVKEAC